MTQVSSILINATSCPQGGSVQVAIGFIREALRQAEARRWRLTLAVLPAVANAVAAEAASAGVKMEIFEVRPGSLIKGRQSRRRIRELAVESNADLVFTVLGPAYVRFDVPEIMGFADPFAIVPQPGCYGNYPRWKIPLLWCVANAKRLLIRSSAHYWVETEAGKRGLVSRVGLAPEKITVVPNGVNALFAQAIKGKSPGPDGEILMLGAGYPHKNHRLLPRVAKLLEQQLGSRPWKFVITLSAVDPTWCSLEAGMEALGLGHRIQNLGILNLAQCAEAYERAAVIFHPSLLEVFSAGYVEAMAARRPLIASDRSFAREVCAEAAVYFDPCSPESAAKCLLEVLTDESVRARLVTSGIERLKCFPDAAEKNGRLCDLIDGQLRRGARA